MPNIGTASFLNNMMDSHRSNTFTHGCIDDGVHQVGLLKSNRAKKIRFFHNGNVFFKGVILPVSPERYKSFEILMSELTNVFTKKVTIPSGVRNVFDMEGQKILVIDDLKDGQDYVCSGKGESFKSLEYGKSEICNNRWMTSSKYPTTTDECAIASEMYFESYKPRYVIIVPHGPKPRKIQRLFLSKRNASTLEQLLKTLTAAADLNTGAVRKVYTQYGEIITTLKQYFDESTEDMFFLYGNQKAGSHDFQLHPEEEKAVCVLRQVSRTSLRKSIRRIY